MKTEIVTKKPVDPPGEPQTAPLPPIIQGTIILASLVVAIIAGLIALTGGPYDVTTAMLGFAATVFGLSRTNIADAIAALIARVKGKSK